MSRKRTEINALDVLPSVTLKKKVIKNPSPEKLPNDLHIAKKEKPTKDEKLKEIQKYHSCTSIFILFL